jgi:nucleoside-triphosphatase
LGPTSEAELTPRILLEGRPGAGKTTVARRLATLLRERGVPTFGFLTEEIRDGGRRVGFRLRTFAGAEAILAHARFSGPPRVGRYGVDLETLETLAIPAVEERPPNGIAIVDELGKMELASEPFRAAVTDLFGGQVPLVATVHAHRHPFTDELKRRPGIELLAVTHMSRGDLHRALADRLTG